MLQGICSIFPVPVRFKGSRFPHWKYCLIFARGRKRKWTFPSRIPVAAIPFTSPLTLTLKAHFGRLVPRCRASSRVGGEFFAEHGRAQHRAWLPVPTEHWAASDEPPLKWGHLPMLLFKKTQRTPTKRGHAPICFWFYPSENKSSNFK